MKSLSKYCSLVIRMIALFMGLFVFFACSGNGDSEKNNTQEEQKSGTIHSGYKKPPSSFSDTIIITGNSAVFYNSDSLQLEKIKEVIEMPVYESNVHDCFFQMRNARMVLKKYWPQIEITETAKYRYILFVKANNKKTCIDHNEKNDMCGIFLFDGIKEPELVDMMNIDTALGYYFSKK